MKRINQLTKKQNEKYGNEIQSTINLKEIETLHNQVSDKYGISLSEIYKNILLITEGMDNNGVAVCASEKSLTTYDLAMTTCKGKLKPTIETLKDEFIVGHIMGGPGREEILEKQPDVSELWEYHKHKALPMTEIQKERTYSNKLIDMFEGRGHFFFGIPYELVTHTDMTHIKDRFEVVGKLKIKESLKRTGGYGYLSTFEEFEIFFNDIEGFIETFRNVKFPVKLLCEIN